MSEAKNALFGILAILGVIYLLGILNHCHLQCDTGDDPAVPSYYQ